MSDQTTDTTKPAGNGESKIPYGLKQVGGAANQPLLSARERVALGIMQSLLRAENPRTRQPKKRELAMEAFELADEFLAVSRGGQ